MVAVDVEESPDVARDSVYEPALSICNTLRLDMENRRVNGVLKTLKKGLRLAGRST
jgi:hypothetical protein